MSFTEAVRRAREELAHPEFVQWDWSLIAYKLRDWPETEAAGLRSLAWVLAEHRYNCSKGDVEGLVEDCERYIAKAGRR